MTDDNNKSYDARTIANWFVDYAKKRGESMPITKLLKLIYISHGWCLAIHGKPLYWDDTEAWRFGPVIPSVYNDFKLKRGEVKDSVADSGLPISDADKDLLKQAYDIYANYSTEHLSNLTHIDDGPWDLTIKNDGWRASIPDELIKLHYDQKLEKAQNSNN